MIGEPIGGVGLYVSHHGVSWCHSPAVTAHGNRFYFYKPAEDYTGGKPLRPLAEVLALLREMHTGQSDFLSYAFVYQGQTVAVDNGNHAAGREAGRAGVSGTTNAIA